MTFADRLTKNGCDRFLRKLRPLPFSLSFLSLYACLHCRRCSLESFEDLRHLGWLKQPIKPKHKHSSISSYFRPVLSHCSSAEDKAIVSSSQLLHTVVWYAKTFPGYLLFFVLKLVHFHCDTQCIQIMPSLRLDHKKPLFYIGERLDKCISRIPSSKQTFSNLSCSKDLIYIILNVENNKERNTTDKLSYRSFDCWELNSLLFVQKRPHW